MQIGTDRFLARALRALDASESALGAGSVDVAAARAYYAMIYAAKALVNERGLRPRAHAALQVALRKHFTATGLLDDKFDRWLEAARGRKNAADEEAVPTLDEAELLLDQARELVAAAEQLLRNAALG